MDLIQYSEAGNPVLYRPGVLADITPDEPPQYWRVAAEVFRRHEGILVVDSGWSDPMRSTHDFHILEVTAQGVGQQNFTGSSVPDFERRLFWKIGPHRFAQMLDTDEQVDSWITWLDSNHLGRAAALNSAIESLDLIKEVA